MVTSVVLSVTMVVLQVSAKIWKDSRLSDLTLVIFFQLLVRPIRAKMEEYVRTAEAQTREVVHATPATLATVVRVSLDQRQCTVTNSKRVIDSLLTKILHSQVIDDDSCSSSQKFWLRIHQHIVQSWCQPLTLAMAQTASLRWRWLFATTPRLTPVSTR